MNVNYKFLLLNVVIILIVLIHEGYAIKCWECRSDHDPKCSDPFDNTTFAMTDCSRITMDWDPNVRSYMCRKIRQKIHGEWRYTRTCAFLGEPGIEGDERFCLMRTGTYNIFMEYCTCNSKDGCNTSNALYKSPLLTLMAVIISFVIYKITR